jgi:hypothetical protein
MTQPLLEEKRVTVRWANTPVFPGANTGGFGGNALFENKIRIFEDHIEFINIFSKKNVLISDVREVTRRMDSHALRFEINNSDLPKYFFIKMGFGSTGKEIERVVRALEKTGVKAGGLSKTTSSKQNYAQKNANLVRKILIIGGFILFIIVLIPVIIGGFMLLIIGLWGFIVNL